MNHIFITPGASNPEGKDSGHWKIMIEENGKRRHLNDAQDHTDAVIKAERAAQKRGLEFAGHGNTSTKVEPQEAEVVDDSLPPYLRVEKPRGAPPIGARIRETLVDDRTVESEVTGYLSTQLVTKTADGQTRLLVLGSPSWTVI